MSVASASADNQLKVKSTQTLAIKNLSLSLFNQQPDRVEELLFLQFHNLVVQKLELEQTSVVSVEFESILLNNVQPKAVNYEVLEVQPSKLLLEKIHDSKFFTMISLKLGQIDVQVDQCFYDSIMTFVEQFMKKK